MGDELIFGQFAGTNMLCSCREAYGIPLNLVPSAEATGILQQKQFCSSAEHLKAITLQVHQPQLP